MGIFNNIKKPINNYNNTLIIQESSKIKDSKTKYKCPYCNFKDTKIKLVSHVDIEHEDMISEEFTAARLVFNYINRKTEGKCVICGKTTEWNETVWRYERFCSDKCVKENARIAKERMMKTYGKEYLLNDDDHQKKMLSHRKISGTYKFQDGGIRSYCGSYEKKLLEFYDKVLNIKSKHIQTPGPTIEYEFDGQKKFWITDLYYIPANLVHDVKDGGDNPNKRVMPEYRAKQIAKEKAVVEQGEYNYIRLTNNSFEQLLLALAEIKEQLMDIIPKENKIIKINENSLSTPVISAVSGAYIIPCMINNTFVDTAFATDSALCNLYMNIDNKIQKIDRIEYEKMYDTTSSILKYNKDDYNQKIDILLNMYKEGIEIEEPNIFYTTLTSKPLLDNKQILFDESFNIIKDDFYMLKLREGIIEASLIYQFNIHMKKDYSFDILNESLKYINKTIILKEDINGYFLLNEKLNIRSKSYKDIKDIPKEVENILIEGIELI